MNSAAKVVTNLTQELSSDVRQSLSIHALKWTVLGMGRLTQMSLVLNFKTGSFGKRMSLGRILPVKV